MFLVVILTVSVCMTLWCWVVSYILGLGPSNPLDPPLQVSPFRLVASIVLPVLIVLRSYYKKRSLSLSGALTALVVGFVLTISNYCFFASLLTFFLAGSWATRLRPERKRRLEDGYKEGGQRNWVQVVCTGGVATEFALFYLMEVGSREATINFSEMYTSSWLCMAVLGSLACSCGDTLASEIGTVYGRTEPRLVPALRKVPIGTNGGITVTGTFFSFVGGVLVGVAYYVMLLLTNRSTLLALGPAQWPIIVLGGVAGLVGSLVDSVIGATLQYSGWDSRKSCVVEQPGPSVERISGFPILDNHSVNLVSCLVMAFLTPRLAIWLWAWV